MYEKQDRLRVNQKKKVILVQRTQKIEDAAITFHLSDKVKECYILSSIIRRREYILFCICWLLHRVFLMIISTIKSK